jgi:enhancer of yellow 2 transcription factor
MADTQEERQKRDEQIRETIMAKLVETGEKDKLKEMLRDRLSQCGWRDELKEYCKEVIRKKGLEKVTVEELVADITPQGRGKNSRQPCFHWHCSYRRRILFSFTIQRPFLRK